MVTASTTNPQAAPTGIVTVRVPAPTQDSLDYFTRFQLKSFPKTWSAVTLQINM
jgi:hypothetical protein